MKIPAIRTLYAAVVLCGIVYAFIVLRGENGIPGLLAKRHQVHEYEEINQKLAREIEQKKDRIQRLQDNPAAQEYEIRQRLKLARPGEKIYILDGGKHSEK
jgi:cell division protein FtsB